jgi:hypothetical protein
MSLSYILIILFDNQIMKDGWLVGSLYNDVKKEGWVVHVAFMQEMCISRFGLKA